MKKNMMSEGRAIVMLNTILTYTYNTSTSGQGLSPAMIVIMLVACVIGIAANWKLFTKAGEPGWACIVPIYSSYVLFKIVYGNGIKFLLLLVPILNSITAIMLYVRLGQRFGKGVGFILGLIFLTPIFLLILAFDDSYYQGPDTQSFI